MHEGERLPSQQSCRLPVQPQTPPCHEQHPDLLIGPELFTENIDSRLFVMIEYSAGREYTVCAAEALLQPICANIPITIHSLYMALTSCTKD